MSCHNVGFSPHDPEALARALSKRAEVCDGCDGVLTILAIQAKVIDNRIVYKVHCPSCEKTAVHMVEFYAPKDTYQPLDC